MSTYICKGDGNVAELLNQNDLNDILTVNDVILPQSAYSTGYRNEQKITVFYISDIHLHFHVDENKSLRMQILRIISSLFNGKLEEMIRDSANFIVLFGGDISVDSEWNAIFYHEFYARWNYILYKEWRKYNTYSLPISQAKARKKYNEELKNTQDKRSLAVNRLKKWMKYDKRHEKMSTYDLIENARKKGLPEYVKYYIKQVKELEQQIYSLESRKSSYIDNLRYGKRYIWKKHLPVFAVLGNHELHGFSTVNEAVNFYRELFRKEGIHFLHNECVNSEHYFRNVPWIPSEFTILGGTGFAKFNHEYNANTVIGALEMTREDEINESEAFYEVYKNAVEESIEKNRLLLVLTHYPTKDWLPNREYNSRCIYFTGHTHRNDSVHTETVNIYANNQIGYDKKEIKFKNTVLGTCYNPFIDYLDGTYEITPEQYMSFYDYCNDSLNGTGHIDRQLQTGNATFYMIKQNGFYGFFVINKSTGAKICSGGVVKNISKVTDIRYFEESFSAVVNEYVMAMLPYRNVQEKIAAEVKKLGFDGTIHGCIIDVDFYNHIMINPLDGQITYYYSPIFGYVCPYATFKDLILSIEDYGMKDKIEEKRLAVALLEESDKRFLLSKNSSELTAYVNQTVKIDIKNSIYKVSNRMNQLQRLFDSNILRDWNDDFAKSIVTDMTKYLPQKSVHSLLGIKKEMGCGMECTVIEDNGYQDITVQFADGTILTKTTREKFRGRNIKHPLLEEVQVSNNSQNIKEKGSFSELYPDLLVDWDYEKNNINPADIIPGTRMMVNWKCHKCDFEWEARVDRRCTGRSICKQCRYRVVERDARIRKK